ncbi:hypothetical protein [Krasilnikovia sp. MM14-A1004]|uniref:hypothetical protein n=1 Tax=Krasilnikovia sp. MM14-A1004 TaxID=3373541 RepID=UPI00399D1BDE
MIPWLAMVRVGRHGIRLWLPLFLLWPLILPFAVALAVGVVIVARVHRVSAAGALRTGWQLVSGWRGMQFEIDDSDVAFQVRFL